MNEMPKNAAEYAAGVGFPTYDEMAAELAALRAELVSIPDELADRFHCLAHAHNHRWHEALCSAVFQLERAEKAEAERDKLLGCRDELREIAEAISDPRIHNTMTIAEWCREVSEKP